MLKPLPFQEPEQIVELYASAAKAATSYQGLGLWTFGAPAAFSGCASALLAEMEGLSTPG
jgi:hypothetical protein